MASLVLLLLLILLYAWFYIVLHDECNILTQTLGTCGHVTMPVESSAVLHKRHSCKSRGQQDDY